MTATTVTLIRRHSGFANRPDAFQVAEEGARIDEYNEEIQEYLLPEGYQVAKNVFGEREIFDPQGKYCEIIQHPSGRPQLVSTATEMPVLKRKDHRLMTPAEFKEARRALGLSVAQMADMLGVTSVQVRRMELREDAGVHRPVMPTTARLVRAYLDGYRPRDWPTPPASPR